MTGLMTAVAGEQLTFDVEGLWGSPCSSTDYLGAPLVVVLGNRTTREEGTALVDALRDDSRTARLPIVQVAYLKGVPRVFKSMITREAARDLGEQIDRAAATHPDLSERQLQLLFGFALDWRAEVAGRFGFHSKSKRVLAFVLDGRGRLVGQAEGDDVRDHVIALIGRAGAR